MSKTAILLLTSTTMSRNKASGHFIIGIMFLCLMMSTKTKKNKNKKTFPANEDGIRSVTISTSYYPRNLSL